MRSFAAGAHGSDAVPRICLCVSLFRPVVGGAERQAERFAIALQRRGIPVCIVTQRLAGQPAEETVEGIPVYRSIRAVERGALYGLTYMTTLGFFLWKNRRRFDILQTTYIYLDAIVAGFLRPWAGFKLVVRPACSGAYGDLARFDRMRFWPCVSFLDTFTRRVLLRLVQRADALVCLTRGLEKELLERAFPPSRLVCIPNDVDPLRFASPSPSTREAFRTALGIPSALPLILFVGRLVPQKGPDVLLHAFAGMIQGGPPAILHLVGDGPMRAELEALAKDLGLQERVLFVGNQERVHERLQAADLFVLPSRSEGMSNALLEAMATGLPCVATRIDGNLDAIEDSVNGLLVPLEDPEALAKAMQTLLQNKEMARRFGSAARLTAESRFASDRILAQYLETYQRLLKEK